MEILMVLSSFGRRKTKPIFSFRVLRAAYRVFEKTKPILEWSNRRKVLFEMGL